MREVSQACGNTRCGNKHKQNGYFMNTMLNIFINNYRKTTKTVILEVYLELLNE